MLFVVIFDDCKHEIASSNTVTASLLYCNLWDIHTASQDCYSWCDHYPSIASL